MRYNRNMNYWLMKSEPTCFSIDDMKNNKVEPWSGVRNYQARNFMKDMKKGDQVLFYHSSCTPPGVVGLVKVAKEAYPDDTALNKKDDHYDPKHTKECPRWFHVDVRFVKKFKDMVTLDQIKFNPKLKDMMVTQRGSRLSVQPVSKKHFDEIMKMSLKK